MPRSMRLALVLAAALALISTAFAMGFGSTGSDGAVDSAAGVHGHAHHQHGGDEGHLAGSSSNVELIGRVDLSDVDEGKIADVGIHNGFAYLAAFRQDSCTNSESTIDGGV